VRGTASSEMRSVNVTSAYFSVVHFRLILFILYACAKIPSPQLFGVGLFCAQSQRRYCVQNRHYNLKSIGSVSSAIYLSEIIVENRPMSTNTVLAPETHTADISNKLVSFKDRSRVLFTVYDANRLLPCRRYLHASA